jgi:hypothetical protein
MIAAGFSDWLFSIVVQHSLILVVLPQVSIRGPETLTEPDGIGP